MWTTLRSANLGLTSLWLGLAVAGIMGAGCRHDDDDRDRHAGYHEWRDRDHHDRDWDRGRDHHDADWDRRY